MHTRPLVLKLPSPEQKVLIEDIEIFRPFNCCLQSYRFIYQCWIGLAIMSLV